MNRSVNQTLKKITKTSHSFLIAVSVISLNLLASSSAQAEGFNLGGASRSIASMDEEILTVPLTKSFITNEKIFAEDDSGVMASIKSDVKSWEKREEFAEIWDLRGIQFYEPVSTADKKAYKAGKTDR